MEITDCGYPENMNLSVVQVGVLSAGQQRSSEGAGTAECKVRESGHFSRHTQDPFREAQRLPIASLSHGALQ